MLMDIRTAKVDNGWILFSMVLDLIIDIWKKGSAGFSFFAAGSAVPLLLLILFVFGMLGAGDIKLFCALGGIMGFGAVWKCICVSFFTGACIALVLLTIHRNFCERLLYFLNYIKNTAADRRIISYRQKDISSPENFHFTIPIFVSVVLYVGGIY